MCAYVCACACACASTGARVYMCDSFFVTVVIDGKLNYNEKE